METFSFFEGLVKKTNQELRFNTTSVYDQKRQSGLRYSAGKEELPELKEEIFPAGQGPIMRRGFLSAFQLESHLLTRARQTGPTRGKGHISHGSSEE